MVFRENHISQDWKGAFSMAINPFLLMAKINGHQQGLSRISNFINKTVHKLKYSVTGIDIMLWRSE